MKLELAGQLRGCGRRDSSGIAFDSSAGLGLPPVVGKYVQKTISGGVGRNLPKKPCRPSPKR
jgi:hypothetical protein